MTQAKTSSNGRLIAIIAMFFLFAMISFVTNLAAPIGTIWGYKFAGNSVLGMMGNMMNFLAYLFMGIPAGNLLVKIGYKKTALWAMIVGIVGLFVQYLSSLIGADTPVCEIAGSVVSLNFFIYLLGAFICGFCVCMLNTVVNPMLNLLGGGGNKGNQLIQSGGALNSLSGTLTPFFVGALIGALTPQTAMSDVAPLLWIAMGVFIAAFIVISFVQIPEPNKSAIGKKVKYSHSPWNFRHTVFGVIAIFFYVGIEIGIPGTLNFYLADQTDKGAGVVGEASTIAGDSCHLLAVDACRAHPVERDFGQSFDTCPDYHCVVGCYYPRYPGYCHPENSNPPGSRICLCRRCDSACKCPVPGALRSLHIGDVGRYLQPRC